MEHLDVLVVGAGLSGVAAGHHLQTSCPWASYAIVEARDAMGGTWDLFRYPGIRSDSDMFTLGYSFRPWPGEQAIADGSSILRYIEDTAREEGIDRHIRFGHRVVAADWSSDEARWHVTIERTDGSGTVELTCGFLFSCTGYYRYDHGHTPDFAGTERFGGTIVHPQHWPEDLDTEGKRIVVIGSGATAITLIPALAGSAEHVTMLQRSPSYVIAAPGESPAAGLLHKVLPDRWSAPATRWAHALGTQAFYEWCQRRPEAAKRLLRKGVERELPEGYDVDTHFTPRYDPWDQRLCVAPGGDLFAAIRDGNASVVTDRIETFTETGLRLESGTELEADVVVTATGLELLFLGGMDLTVDGEAVEPSERLTYKGMMLEGVPNLALAVGYTNASWTLKCELTCEVVARLLNELRQRGVRQVTPINDDASITPEPLLGLSSGYVQRAVDRFPQQGSRRPWRNHQSYLADYRAMKGRDVLDEGLVLSDPDLSSAGPRHRIGSDAERSPLGALGRRAGVGRSGAHTGPDRFAGRVVAITGAGSGIGRALAVELARRGAHLALSDVDEVGLAETVGRCEGRGVKVTAQVVDVAGAAAIGDWAEQVVAEHGQVHVVVNNAGVALMATVAEMSDEDLEWLLDIDLMGVVRGTRAFLPHLRASGDGHVVNVSSVFGLISIPGQSAYNTAKFGVRGFTDALRMELEIEGAPVSATTVHPGGIRTNIVRNARLDASMAATAGDLASASAAFDRVARTSPERAAQRILEAVERDRRRVTIGPDAKVIDLLSRLPTGWYQRAIVAAARRRR